MSDRSTRIQIEESDGTLMTPGKEDTLNKIPGLSIPIHDYISVAYPSGDTEVYTFKTGGAGGSTVATLTIVYTDSTKDKLLTVTKS